MKLDSLDVSKITLEFNFYPYDHGKSLFFLFSYLCVCLCVDVEHVLVCHGNADAWARGETGVTDGCEPPDVSAWNPVPLKNCKCSLC